MSALPQENVQGFPRPPVLEPVTDELRVVLGGETIASTHRGWRILETHHAPTYYFPPGDIASGVLRPARGRSFCEWKGRARYWTAEAGGAVAEAAAWSYDLPTRPFAGIAGYVAFYANRFDACYVGPERVIPQPGSFYGGWVTSNLTGEIKGAPGTEGW